MPVSRHLAVAPLASAVQLSRCVNDVGRVQLPGVDLLAPSDEHWARAVVVLSDLTIPKRTGSA